MYPFSYTDFVMAVLFGVGSALTEADFGIPRFEAINAKLAGAYDLEPAV